MPFSFSPLNNAQLQGNEIYQLTSVNLSKEFTSRHFKSVDHGSSKYANFLNKSLIAGGGSPRDQNQQSIYRKEVEKHQFQRLYIQKLRKSVQERRVIYE